VFVYLGFQIISYDIKQQNSSHCGTPFVAFMFLCFGLLILQLITVILQLIYKRYQSKKQKRASF